MDIKNDLLERANRLFIENNYPCEDEVKIFFYNLITAAIPEISENSEKIVLLDKLREVYINDVPPIHAGALEMYYYPETTPSYDYIADSLGLRRESIQTIIEHGINYISRKKNEFLINN